MTSLLLAIIYLTFISLGLPDSLLGSAWPTMYREFSVPISYAGIISMIIAIGTVISSLMSDRMTLKLGTGKVTAISVALTAFALFAFSMSNSFILLCIIALPYGLGAGGIDAALNNYVALHYSSRHMSWLHCMWGVGASFGPYIMGLAISHELGWMGGYRYVGIIQLLLAVIIVVSLPLWKMRNIDMKHKDKTAKDREQAPLSLKEIVSIPGAKAVMIIFFCYCALEQTTGLWASSYLVLNKGVNPEIAASFASMFFIGITLGRAISGFMTLKFSDMQMIHIGIGVVLLGIISLSLPFGQNISLIGFVLIGLGCAPIYPSIIHSTPAHFGADKSQAIIGVQMASAYIGICVMPPLFGLIANQISVGLLPYYLLLILIVMFIMIRKLERITK